MQNPAWLPHAKLHAAIALLAAVALGGGALVCLLARPVTDAFSMAMGGYLAGAFWVALIGAGAWPDTSYYFADDPVYGAERRPGARRAQQRRHRIGHDRGRGRRPPARPRVPPPAEPRRA